MFIVLVINFLLVYVLGFVLKVVKKVMEMDEAVPFGAPVDPVSQGIPVSVNCCLVQYLC